MGMLEFNFAAKTIAYKRLAQSLRRSVSADSGFIPEYLEPVVQADQSGYYVDNFRIAANSAADPTRNIGAVFESI